ncbi:uncharacterized protein zgc:193801 isoform X1 [Silurus meridionalis]|uniref:C2H2-type domain-containing protein n=2 Tax=Silurus meridionalis TaxID=175797 RepID=A0A8T0AWP7_SILME|nr:uncharacterized protein zgc:193801 isoform X1 [Silurus meridionalis]KAF7696799.1 hypothetical protein HF521_005217 [Silurus meridionalis]KAI5096312.1 hypothetical protein C0J45_13206 [Silurus meridionalis]
MAAFVAHPSVRIRATEHSYVPVLCQDDKCAGREKGVHMHCPLCTVAEAYQDPVILVAHFRIKHVDKSIDFAGLKVLRCCNHCEIVGTIKGEKRFKGAHWHCYRCRNGFNRRDEAVKHYKTHFRNPHTTFQIQVTQDVNCRQYYKGNPEANAKAYSGLAVSSGGDGTAVSSVITPPVLTTSSTTETTTLLTVESKEDGESNGMPLGAEEEVGSSQHASARTQTLVLMDPDGNTGNLIYDEATGIITEQSEESLDLQKHLLELSEQMEILRQEKEGVEKSLRSEIRQLKEQIASLVQSNVKMFEELQLYRCPDHSQQRLAKLMDSLQTQHKELLQAQLASLRQEILSQASSVSLNGHTETLELHSGGDQSQDQVEVQGNVVGEVPELEIIAVPLQEEQIELRGQLVEFRPQEDTLSSLESPRSDTAVTQDLEVKQEDCLVSRKRCSEEDCRGTSEDKIPRVS